MRCVLGLAPPDLRDGDRGRPALPRAGRAAAPGGRPARPSGPPPRAPRYRHLLAWPGATGCRRARVDEVIDAGRAWSPSPTTGSGASPSAWGSGSGIAAALLGDPDVLLLDEPVNGLDPEGIRWVRELLRALADEGRTVLVSSHLMSEMEDTADHLVVLGRGRLLADVPMAELLGAHSAVRVRTPQGADAGRRRVRRAGGRVELEIDGALRIEGLGLTEVGDVAFVADVRLHELSRVTASLEAAYLDLTDADVEYRAMAR